MAELPSNWGMTTEKRADGKLDILAKDDAGRNYKVRTCDTGEVTPRDVEELHYADREAVNAKESVEYLCRSGRSRQADAEESLWDDLTEAAGPVVRAGLGREGSTVGSSHKYRQNYDVVFGVN